MKLGIRVIVLAAFVITILVLISVRSCETPASRGEEQYLAKCAKCHGKNGEGLKQLYPPLNDPMVLEQYAAQMACIIAYGIDDTLIINGIEYNQPMEPIADINSIQMANLLNFMLNEWGAKDTAVSLIDIETQLQNCQIP
ncbi:MAG TPA: hypothetical protein DDX92_00820 [Flavobacteriales bacterium]|nr:hypothetical protein [Flavobacteriales bacterium]